MAVQFACGYYLYVGKIMDSSAENINYWLVDYKNQLFTIVFSDGKEIRNKLPISNGFEESQLSQQVLDCENWWIYSETLRGHWIMSEGYNPNSQPPLNGRAVVYLDQNHWRILSDALFEPSAIADSKLLRAAEELIALVFECKVVLPLSMGHLLEISALHGEVRYRVGLAMASLARGWQIRHPIDLWKSEARSSIRAHLKIGGDESLHEVVTEPGALFESANNLGVTADMSDIEKLTKMLSGPNILLTQLLEPVKIPKEQGTNWSEYHARITAQMEMQQVTKHQRRKIAIRRYWNENLGFYIPLFREFTGSFDSPTLSDSEITKLFSESPMVGLLSELFVNRFIDVRTKWNQNDLVDMLYLSSAAGYVDYVCAEKHTGTQLREAQKRLGRNSNVFISIRELVDSLKLDGIKSEK